MSRLRSLATIVALLTSTLAAAAEPVEIPLKEIWALDMPGTRNLHELVDNKEGNILIEGVRKQIRDCGDECGGIVVEGEGVEALKAILRVGEVRDNRIEVSAGAPLTLVFFTRPVVHYVHLRRVERQGTAIRIFYAFVPKDEAHLPQQLALIPLGELRPGDYSVKVELPPMPKEYADRGMKENPDRWLNALCRSFHFEVVQGSEQVHSCYIKILRVTNRVTWVSELVPVNRPGFAQAGGLRSSIIA